MSVILRQATLEDAPGISRVHVDSWREAYPGIMPDDLLTRLSYEQREQGWRRVLELPNPNEFVVVAVDEATGQIVGFTSGHTNGQDHPDYPAELRTLYLLQAYQGQGVGKGLFWAMADHFRQLGYSRMLLWMATKNSRAAQFYAAQGGQVILTRWNEWGGHQIHDTAYGFEL